MNLNDYFDPVALDKPKDYFITSDSIFGKNIKINTPSSPIGEISDYQIALLGVTEDRNSNNQGTSLAPDKIRNKLYQLYRVNNKTKIIDLGNVKPGNTFSDTYFGLQDVILELLNNQVTFIILGGSQDLTYACYEAYEQIKDTINLVTVDFTIDINTSTSGSENYLSDLLNNKKLFKYTNLGHQQYLTDKSNLELLNRLYFESVRLGNLKNKLFLTEPVLRDADIVSLDIGAVKHADAPARIHTSPNGFLADEICQIARYSGIGDNVSCFGIYEINPKFDINNQTAHLAAQIIWYFIDGYSMRKSENRIGENKDYKVFFVSHENMEHDLTFYKSSKTERWWMEVPSIKSGKNIYIACSQEDYEQACNHDIPDRWWKSFQKIN